MRSAEGSEEMMRQVFQMGSPYAPEETAMWTPVESGPGECSLTLPERLGSTWLTIQIVSPALIYLTLKACFQRDIVLEHTNSRKQFGICYCSQGDSMLLLSGRKRELNPGSLFYFDGTEGSVRMQCRAGERYLLSSFLLQNYGGVTGQYQYPLFHAFERAAADGTEFPCVARSPQIARIFERCFPDGEQDIRVRNVILTSKLMAISAVLLEQGIGEVQESIRGISAEEREMLEEARQLLLRDFSDPPTIGKIAHAVGMNETKLKRDFKQLFGLPVYQYFKKAKMERAMELLTNTDLSVREIAFRCGYDSQSQFSAAFRASYNLAPLDAHKKFGIFMA